MGINFKLKMGEVVIFPEPLDWCKIVIDNKLNCNVILNVSA